MAGYETGGVANKYNITKRNGHPIDPEARYFVLRVDKDPNARLALFAYATSVQACNLELRTDLLTWLQSYESLDDLRDRLSEMAEFAETQSLAILRGHDVSNWGKMLNPEDYRN